MLWVKVLFWQKKRRLFAQKNPDISKIKKALVIKVIFYDILWNYMFVYLRDKFEVSSIILTGFRQGPPPSPLTSKRKPKKLTQIRVNWQMENFTTFKRWRCSTCGSLKKFWYFQSWSSNPQTSCLWISRKVLKINKTFLKYSLARDKSQFKLQYLFRTNSWSTFMICTCASTLQPLY